MRAITKGFNESIEGQDEFTRNEQFYPMLSDQGFVLEGNKWVKRDVIVDSTVWGNEKATLSFLDYKSFTNRLNAQNYINEDRAEEIDGRQIKFEMYVNMAQTEVSNAYEVLKQDFDNYKGTNAYQPGEGGFETFSETAAQGKTEYYRLTWASSYYSYLEQQGLEKASAPMWDKQLWDSDPNNDGKSDYFSMSIFDVGKVGFSVAMTLTGAGAALGPVIMAGLNAGISMAHDTANMLVGAMTLDQYGMSMLRNGISGVTGMLTGGIGMGKDMLSFGSEIANGLVSSSISAVGNLATSGLKLNKEGKLDWYMSGSEWSSWGLGSIASVGSAGLNGLGVGKTLGGWTANAMGGGNTGWGSIMGMGVQKATEGFISSSLTSLAKSYDWSTGQWSAYDWKNVAQGTFTGLASGAMTGAVGYMMGGSYANGGMNFSDRYTSMAAKQDVSLNYANKLNQIGNTIGSLAGEATSLAFDGQFTVNMGDGVGIGFGSRGVVRDDYGGVSLGEMLVSARDWRYADFQMKNNWSAEGQSRISLVNLAGMSGLGFGKATAEDIISGKKKLVFSDALDASKKEYGHADRDNKTIMLSSDAIMSESDANLGSKLAWYTSTMSHEGLHLYQDPGSMSKEDLERQAYYGGSLMLSALDQRLGLTVEGSGYEEMAQRGTYFAITGDAEGAGLDMSGDALKIATARGIKKVTVEAYTNTPEGRKNDVTGIARALGISEGEVIKYLLSTGRYKSEDDVWSHLKAGEELYAQDGKILTAADVAKKDGLGGFLDSVGTFSANFVNGVVENGKEMAAFYGGIWNSITGGYDAAKSQELLNIVGENFPGSEYMLGGGQQGADADGKFDCVGSLLWPLRYPMGYKGVGYIQTNGQYKYDGWDVGRMRDYLPTYLISEDQLKPGDLILFNYRRANKGPEDLTSWNHVVIVGQPTNIIDRNGNKVATYQIYQASNPNKPNSVQTVQWIMNWATDDVWNSVVEYRRINWKEAERRLRNVPKKQ